jgi:hypothetical protein
MRWLFASGLVLSLVLSSTGVHAQPLPDGAVPSAPPKQPPEEDYLLLIWSPPPAETKPDALPSPAPVPPAPIPLKGSLPTVTAPASSCSASPGCCPAPHCPASCCPASCCLEYPQDKGKRFWVQAEALAWWIKDSKLPPLVTTSPQTSLGVLGASDTRVLFGGNTDNEGRWGGRFTAGLWLDDCQRWGAATSFFFLGQRSVNFTNGSAGAPLLARPFFNVVTGTEDAEQVANLLVPSLPNLLPLQGRISASLSSRMWGLEGNGLHSLVVGCNYHVDLLGGFRYVKLDEGLNIDEELFVPPSSPTSAGEHFLLVDNFGTRNNFYGGQLGARGEFRRGRWSLDVLTKVALGVSDESVVVKGNTQISAPGQSAQDFRGGLLALPTNIGTYHHDPFAVVPEVGFNVGYQITSHLRAKVGYSFLYLSSVARPGNEINRALNPTQLPPHTLVGVAQPAFLFKDTDFWTQGINAGLEYDY